MVKENKLLKDEQLKLQEKLTSADSKISELNDICNTTSKEKESLKELLSERETFFETMKNANNQVQKPMEKSYWKLQEENNTLRSTNITLTYELEQEKAEIEICRKEIFLILKDNMQ